MCGIVGYLGGQNPKQVILDGLKKLEYRGYDSAGVAIMNSGRFSRVRAEGKLRNLAEKLKDEEFKGRMGIGHTRWATHGEPTEANAHPHIVEGVSLVHNGIIENYNEIREELNAKGVEFESETDSELVAHLLAGELKLSPDLCTAARKVMPRLQGAYAILAAWEDQSDRIVAFKNGPPLVIGVGGNEMFVVSDLQACLEHTSRIVHLEDEEIAIVQEKAFKVCTPRGDELAKTEVKVAWSADQIEKHGFSHFMLKEIHEQPRAVAAAMDPHIDLKNLRVRLNRLGFGCKNVEQIDQLDFDSDLEKTDKVLNEIRRIFVVACGTSFYAAMMAEYLLEKLCDLPVEVDIASEFRYRKPVIPSNSLVILISQSGETADTLAALRLAKQCGATTLSICNVKCSSMDREADGHFYMNAGVEVGVASTKALAATLTVVNLFALYMAKTHNKLSKDDEQRLLRSLIAAPSHLEHVLAYDKFFNQASETLKQFKGFLYMGRGVSYPIAMEGALKMKELAYMHAEGYAAGEMKHGPLALIDEKMCVVMIAPRDSWYEKTLSNLEEVRARRGKIISIGVGQDQKLERLSQHYLGLPEVEWTVFPLLALVPVQLMAFHVAEALGHDVDQPRNLAKSVTVE